MSSVLKRCTIGVDLNPSNKKALNKEYSNSTTSSPNVSFNFFFLEYKRTYDIFFTLLVQLLTELQVPFLRCGPL